MSKSAIYGVWTYRSFINRGASATHLSELLLAEGEMVFEQADPGAVRGQLAFRGHPLKTTDQRLTLTGSIEQGSPATVRFRGVGVPTTSAKGWIYDYVAYLVPDWSNGVQQVTALVGSVIRSVSHTEPHGAVSPAGTVYSFVAVRRDFIEPRVVIPLPPSVRDMLASRQHRLHHNVWHGTRNFWLGLSGEKRKQITVLGWKPREPALAHDRTPLVGNGSGEDFLFMHRQMILEVNAALVRRRHPAITGWPAIPPPGPLLVEPNYRSANPVLPPVGNPDGFTVPPAWIIDNDEETTRRVTALKTDDYYWTRMMWWDRQFKDPHFLCTLTLGELGSLLETSIHNDMHMRWSSIPRDPKTGIPVPGGRPASDISADPWDDPTNDYLGDFYSSHVHPVFWRLHGWVDDRITDWFNAHEAAHKGEVIKSEVGGVPWFEVGKWISAKDPWAGPVMKSMVNGMRSGQSMRGDRADIQKMEQVSVILFGENQAGKPGAHAARPAQMQHGHLAWY